MSVLMRTLAGFYSIPASLICNKLLFQGIRNLNSLHYSIIKTTIQAHTIHCVGSLFVKDSIQKTEYEDTNNYLTLSTDIPRLTPLEDVDLVKEIKKLQSEENNVLESCQDDISTVAPYFAPTFNFAAYINKSPTLQELLKLGVDLHKLEKRKGIPQYVLKLDFDRDMKQHVRFLHDVGVDSDELGGYLTKNPLIFKETLDDLTIRVNYLQSKQFSPVMIGRIVSQNPYWLMFSTRRIDHRLGYFQKSFRLTGNEVRALAVKQPRLITYNMFHIKINTFVVKEEMGFTDEEMKELLLLRPRLWMINQVSLKTRFNYVHNIMKIPHEQIIKHPQVLGSREFRIKQRHMFLKELGRAQYDPHLEGYVPLQSLVTGSDVEFCKNVAKSSVETFNMFLKSL